MVCACNTDEPSNTNARKKQPTLGRCQRAHIPNSSIKRQINEHACGEFSGPQTKQRALLHRGTSDEANRPSPFRLFLSLSFRRAVLSTPPCSFHSLTLVQKPKIVSELLFFALASGGLVRVLLLPSEHHHKQKAPRFRHQSSKKDLSFAHHTTMSQSSAPLYASKVVDLSCLSLLSRL